jgi:hypothetical protein
MKSKGRLLLTAVFSVSLQLSVIKIRMINDPCSLPFAPNPLPVEGKRAGRRRFLNAIEAFHEKMNRKETVSSECYACSVQTFPLCCNNPSSLTICGRSVYRSLNTRKFVPKKKDFGEKNFLKGMKASRIVSHIVVFEAFFGDQSDGKEFLDD